MHFFTAFSSILGDVTMIYASLPAFVTFLARIFLKEPFGIFEAINICLSMVGVFLVMQPSFVFRKLNNVTDDHGHFITSLIVFVGVCAAAINLVINRSLKVSNNL